jgi:RNA polymerase sigma-70 factor (ECF subfamily)
MHTQPRIDEEFLRLIDNNRQRILRLARVYAPTRPDADDLFQEILFQIWRCLPKLKDAAYANTWLYRVAINTGISFVRKTKAQPKSVSIDQNQLLDHPDPRANADDEPDPQLEMLRTAMGTLNKVEKAIVTLYLEDLSYDQIAEVMGMNANHVGVLLHRTKKKLFELMQEAPHE